MELQAALESIHLYSPDPVKAADFYRRVYGLDVTPDGDALKCSGPGRTVLFSTGPASQLRHAHFSFGDAPAWHAFEKAAAALQIGTEPAIDDRPSMTFLDPDGTRIIFTAPAAVVERKSGDLPRAALQHFALRTPRIEESLRFYVNGLGFVISDLVRDASGTLRACFLRSNHLHHALALFAAPAVCFDHQSFEVEDWDSMKTWADHVAREAEPIVWGIGRHGPGNDVFFMVRDPDGNLAEISAELEHCPTGRPAGIWPHEERTLNLWGKAIMRS